MSRSADIPSRRARLLSVLGLATVVLAQFGAAPASAQGKLDARYEVTLAGIPVGRGTWTIEIAEDHYSTSVSGATVGLLKAISGGHGNGTAQGRVVNGEFAPVNYTATSETSKKAETIRIALNGGNVTESSITPEPPADDARIPVTDAHRHGVLDPMTGSMIRVPGTGNLLGPEACKSAAAIFDGRMRYDLRLDYKRMDTVKAEKGYRGPAVVCGIYFTPVSGYVPDRAAIKYLAAQKAMEVWLVPIAGTRVLVPFKLSIPTPLGHGVLVATQFNATAIPPRAASR
ncbi:MAG: DUF3108 domain-containing protein [Rhizobiales bacterium]|nr:DUF3108 domain-containing protein [Hyphomicrobiales bacterium]